MPTVKNCNYYLNLTESSVAMSKEQIEHAVFLDAVKEEVGELPDEDTNDVIDEAIYFLKEAISHLQKAKKKASK